MSVDQYKCEQHAPATLYPETSSIVMAIMGGAVLPKVVDYVADQLDRSRGFILPMVCFIFVAIYGFNWPKWRGAASLHSIAAGSVQ
jgi:FHS family L-fucose permease-like MFS transporter